MRKLLRTPLLDSPSGVNYRMLLLRGLLELEVRGFRFVPGPQPSDIVRQDYGFRGKRQQVLVQYEQLLTEMGLVESPKAIGAASTS